jgi:carbonic anhydrase
MDGRAQLPVINWIKDNYNVDYVDMITDAGMVGVLSSEKYDIKLLKKLNISANEHGSQLVFIAGHHDCAGNPVSDDLQKKQVNISVNVIKNLAPPLKVTGLWLDENFEVSELISL